MRYQVCHWFLLRLPASDVLCYWSVLCFKLECAYVQTQIRCCLLGSCHAQGIFGFFKGLETDWIRLLCTVQWRIYIILQNTYSSFARYGLK